MSQTVQNLLQKTLDLFFTRRREISTRRREILKRLGLFFDNTLVSRKRSWFVENTFDELELIRSGW